jgi:hypothetical protein
MRQAGGFEVWKLGEAQDVLVVPHGRRGLAMGHETVRPELPRLVVDEHIAPRDAERWIATGRPFADAAGNAFLDLPGLTVRVLGRRPIRAGRAGRTARPDREDDRYRERENRDWRGPTLRCLFHLLCKPELIERPIRELATLGKVAPGTVTRLFDELEAMQCLVRPTDATRRLFVTDELRDRWIGDFVRRMRPRLLIGRFAPTDPNWHHDFDPVAHGAVWGAESAAATLGADLRPGIQTLYITGAPMPILKRAGLRADRNGTVELRQRFWTTEIDEPPAVLAPKLLIAADLIGTRDPRCLDAARWLLKTSDV